jgi:hypothetical protein
MALSLGKMLKQPAIIDSLSNKKKKTRIGSNIKFIAIETVFCIPAIEAFKKS